MARKAREKKSKPVGMATANPEGGYNPAQQAALEALAPAISEAFARKRAEEDLRTTKEAMAQITANLEALVRQRTAQLEEANQQLREDDRQRKLLERKLLVAVDQERHRLGQELHDGLCAVLTGAKFKLGLLQRKLASNTAVNPAEAAAVEQDLNGAIQQARAMAKGLSPVRLLAEGLASALEEMAASIQASSGVHCECYCADQIALPGQGTAQQLYRIAQEALQNAVKHSKAKEVRIELKEQGEHILLTIRDDGIGFFPAARRGAGMGLENMRARADLIGGVLEINSRPQGGTVVSCAFPRPKERSLTPNTGGVL